MECLDSKRLFIGFAVKPAESMLHAMKRIRISMQRQNMEAEWVREPNLHVTLNFLGSTRVALIPQIQIAMKQVASSSSAFRVDIRGVGGFPDEHHTRTLWMGVRKTSRLNDLQQRMTEALQSLGFAVEEREYLPHLTICKIRKSRSVVDAISPFVRKQLSAIQVSELVLFESRMQSSHLHYEPIARAPLALEKPEE